MLAESTARRLLPELAVLLVAGVAAAGILTTFGGKEAADTDAVAWRQNVQAACAGSLPQAREAGDIARRNAAAVAELQGVADATLSATLVSGAARMSERSRELATAFRGFQTPGEGVDRAEIDQAVARANALATSWESLITEYAALETTPAGDLRQRIGDWTLRIADAADRLGESFARLDLNSCGQVAESLAPTA
ncbi:MAG: hypothetical protein ACT4QF_18900 [Sporichthyaceae bacterium]|jgi:hypothetical protein